MGLLVYDLERNVLRIKTGIFEGDSVTIGDNTKMKINEFLALALDRITGTPVTPPDDVLIKLVEVNMRSVDSSQRRLKITAFVPQDEWTKLTEKDNRKISLCGYDLSVEHFLIIVKYVLENTEVGMARVSLTDFTETSRTNVGNSNITIVSGSSQGFKLDKGDPSRDMRPAFVEHVKQLRPVLEEDGKHYLRLMN